MTWLDVVAEAVPPLRRFHWTGRRLLRRQSRARRRSSGGTPGAILRSPTTSVGGVLLGAASILDRRPSRSSATPSSESSRPRSCRSARSAAGVERVRHTTSTRRSRSSVIAGRRITSTTSTTNTMEAVLQASRRRTATSPTRASGSGRRSRGSSSTAERSRPARRAPPGDRCRTTCLASRRANDGDLGYRTIRTVDGVDQTPRRAVRRCGEPRPSRTQPHVARATRRRGRAT